MTIYKDLLRNKPLLTVKENTREVVINLVSCMCDNAYTWTMKKNKDGDFKITTHGFAFSNFQTKASKDEIEWEADSGNWENVFDMINSGTSLVKSVRSR